jgi:hypothetical protein
VVNYSGILGSFSSRESRERSLWWVKILKLISNFRDCRYITFNNCGYTTSQRSAA